MVDLLAIELQSFKKMIVLHTAGRCVNDVWESILRMWGEKSAKITDRDICHSSIWYSQR